MVQSKPSGFIPYINTLCFLIFILSIIVICISGIFLEIYSMFYLKDWDDAFRIAPSFALGLGIFCVIVTTFGFYTAGYENRVLLVILGILLLIAFVSQIAAIFVFLKVKAFIDQRLEDNALNRFEASLYNTYGSNDYVTKSWDIIQETYRCCGLSGSGEAYRNWFRGKIGFSNVPDSCCVVKTSSCGMHIGDRKDVKGLIFTSSCNQMIQSEMENEVVPMIYVYCAVGVLLLLSEITLIFLFIVLIVQITRRISKQHELFNKGLSNQVNYPFILS